MYTKADLEAMRYTMSMWHWLWMNPDKSKTGYPGWKMEYGGCALCALVRRLRRGCGYCLMRDRWPGSKGLEYACADSAYKGWISARNNMDRVFFAKIVMDSLDDLYWEIIDELDLEDAGE